MIQRLRLVLVTREEAWLRRQLERTLGDAVRRLAVGGVPEAASAHTVLLAADDLGYPRVREVAARLCAGPTPARVSVVTFDEPAAVRALLGLPLAGVFFLPEGAAGLRRAIEEALEPPATVEAHLPGWLLSGGRGAFARALAHLARTAESAPHPPPGTVVGLAAEIERSARHLSREARKRGARLPGLLDLFRVYWLRRRCTSRTTARRMARLCGYADAKGLEALLGRTLGCGVRVFRATDVQEIVRTIEREVLRRETRVERPVVRRSG